MAEETNPANPDETKTQGEADEKQPAAKEAAPKAEAAPKRPAAKKTAKPKKEQPSAAAGAPESLSLSTEEVDKPIQASRMCWPRSTTRSSRSLI